MRVGEAIADVLADDAGNKITVTTKRHADWIIALSLKDDPDTPSRIGEIDEFANDITRVFRDLNRKG